MSIKDNYMSRMMAMLPADPSALEKSLLAAYYNPEQAELAGLNKYAILTKLQELNANKQARANQLAQSQAQMPTVVEQILAEATPQPGIAGIPVTNIGNEETYATGGIVAFEHGGDVQGYTKGEEVKRKGLTAEQFRALTAGPDFTLYPYDESARYLHPELSEETMRLVLPQMPVVGDYPQLRKPAAKQDWYMQGKPKADVADWYVQRPETKGAPILGKENVGQTTPAVVDPAYIDKLMASQGELPSVAPRTDGGSMYARDSVRASRTTPVGAAPAAASGFGVAPMKFEESLYEGMLRPEVSAEQQAERYQKALGEDPTRAKMAERIGKMEAENTKFKDQYPWMALAEAGFGMAAGKSPFALQNIAEGGKQGMAALTKGREQMLAQEEKLFNLQARISEAERAEKAAALKYGFDSEERIKETNRLTNLEKQKDRMQVNIANKNLEVQGKQYEQKERDMLMDAMLRREGFAVQRETARSPKDEIEAIMEDLRVDFPEMPKSERRKRAYEIKGAVGMASNEQRNIANQRTAIVDRIEAIQKAHPFGANMSDTTKKELIQLQSQLNSLGSGNIPTSGAPILTGWGALKVK